jgi:hypothetical protein
MLNRRSVVELENREKNQLTTERFFQSTREALFAEN